MAPHLVIPVRDASRVGEARRAATHMALDAGFDDTSAARVAIAVTELGTNLVRHATQGRLLLAPRPGGPSPAIELVSLDDGPGIEDVERCLADGYSTAGSAGQGLGAVQRQADEFDMYSRPGQGTIVAATLRARTTFTPRVMHGAEDQRQRFQLGGVAITAPGELVSGDAWSFAEDGARLSLAVVDGLGHGPDAHAAARQFVELFERHAFDTPSSMLQSAHEPMRHTRGAAASIARFDADRSLVTFSGVGNVMGRIVSGTSDRSLLSQHGTLGVQIRKLSDLQYEWPAHALLILHSDGIASRWDFSEDPGLLRCHPLVVAGWLIRAHTRGRDDATVVVVRRAYT